jgi:ADP-ribosylglycohydrolase
MASGLQHDVAYSRARKGFFVKYEQQIDAYRIGDGLGATEEGLKSDFSAKKMIALLNDTAKTELMKGTDESDILRCWQDFTHGNYSFHQNGSHEQVQDYVCEWMAYHQKNSRVTTYGRTWQDVFTLVKYLRAAGHRLDHEELVVLSKDRDSMGNGCLGMIFPMWVVWSSVHTVAPWKSYVQSFIEPTHAHNNALGSCYMLWSFFANSADWRALRGVENFNPTPEATCLAHGCLRAAMLCAKGAKNFEQVVRRASKLGGDVDSYLSLAFLMHSYETRVRTTSDRGF